MSLTFMTSWTQGERMLTHIFYVVFPIGMVGVWLMTVLVGGAIISVRKEERDAALRMRDDLQVRLDRATSSGADLAPKVGWRKRRLMNKPEFALYRDLSALVACGQAGHRLFAQVAYGAFLEVMAREDRKDMADAAYHAVHRKVADFVLIDRFGQPIAVIEYQGEGHYHGNAHARDQAKRIACQKAGLPFIEISATGLTHGQRLDLKRLLGIPTELAAE